MLSEILADGISGLLLKCKYIKSKLVNFDKQTSFWPKPVTNDLLDGLDADINYQAEDNLEIFRDRNVS